MTPSGPIAVGYYSTASSILPLAWQGSAYTKLPLPPNVTEGYAYGVSNAGSKNSVAWEFYFDYSLVNGASQAIWDSLNAVLSSSSIGSVTSSVGGISASGTITVSDMSITIQYSGYNDASSGVTVNTGTVTFSGTYSGTLSVPLLTSPSLSIVGSGLSMSGSIQVSSASINAALDMWSGIGIAQSSTGTAVLNDITYPASFLLLTSSTDMPCVWTNGALSVLPLPDGSISGFANAVASEADVYVCGAYQNSGGTQPAYWKNGAYFALALPSAATGGDANGVAIVGSDLYIGGEVFNASGNIPCYWKNGVSTLLPLPAGSTTGSVYAVAATGSTVNFIGYVDSGSSQIPCYWTVGGSGCNLLQVPTATPYGVGSGARSLKPTP